MSRFFGEKPIQKIRQIFGMICVSFLLVGCWGELSNVPVSEKSMWGSHHTVVQGETLYSIAWRYNVDFKELAKTNAITSPYTIRPGQRVYMSKKTRSPVGSESVTNTQSNQPEQKQPAAQSSLQGVKNSTSLNNKATYSTQIFIWRWPNNGKVAHGFATQNGLNKGIDIVGKLGEPVVAAASGTVVYAGSGLLGYGQLIIVKHNEQYLSAYAHNSRLLVNENDTVSAGQKIAEMGSTGTDRVKLHFEIRKDGKPVDPLLYLTKR